MKIWVKPGGPDRRVPWPTTGRARRYFPNDIADQVAPPSQVEKDGYITRRLADGDLIETDETGKPLKAATPVPQPTAKGTATPAAAPTPKEG